MKLILFSQADYNRKKEFTILTQLISQNGEKYISKKALYPEGNEYIKTISKNYEHLSKEITIFKLPETKLERNSLRSDFIDKPNLAAEIESLLIEGKIKDANTKVVEFVEFLNSIPVVKDNPYEHKEFIGQFDPKKEHIQKDKIDCWYPGFHDVNFDNFIKKDGHYYFVDFEWVFDVPIPKDYLILRSIFYLSVKLNRIITGMISEDFKCVSFFPNVLTPIDWLKLTKNTKTDLQMMFDYEYNLFSSKFRHFQKFPKVPKDYFKHVFTEPVKPQEHEITVLNTQLTNLSGKIDTLTSNLGEQLQYNANKDNEISSLKKTILELEDKKVKLEEYVNYVNERYSKYDRKAYRIFEKFESSRVGQSRILKALGKTILKVYRKVK